MYPLPLINIEKNQIFRDVKHGAGLSKTNLQGSSKRQADKRIHRLSGCRQGQEPFQLDPYKIQQTNEDPSFLTFIHKILSHA